MTDVYLEIGKKRTFACAIDWPGWARSGRDETSSLHALLDYGPRYARALGHNDLGFEPPTDVSAFNVIERLQGTQRPTSVRQPFPWQATGSLLTPRKSNGSSPC